MSAKEMFEELDYYVYQTNNDNTCILYKEKRTNTFIRFYSNLTGSVQNIKKYYKNLILEESCNITLEELQAINKQVEELHWKVEE